MAFLKTVGCDCPECGPDPCTAGCACTLDIGNQDAGSQTDNYDVTGQFLVAHDIFIRVTADAGVSATARFVVSFNGVPVYDSGCISATSASTTVNAPAGTTSISVAITSPCSGGSDDWDYILECA